MPALNMAKIPKKVTNQAVRMKIADGFFLQLPVGF